MGCETWRGRLDAWLDGELDAAEGSALRDHIQACGACSAEALDRVLLKRSVATAGRRYEPGADLRARITRLAGKPRRRMHWTWQSLAMPAALIVIVAMATVLYAVRERALVDPFYGELADLHVTALASATPVDVVSSDRHTVKPWFQGKIPFSFDLPILEGSEFTLLGGRVAYVEQTPAAQLIFQLRKHMISVFIFQETIRLPSGAARARSFNMNLWTQDGLRYVVVGDAGAGDIEALARLMRAGR